MATNQMPGRETTLSRMAAARRRSRAAQAGLGALAVAVFGGSMLLARAHAAGHVKQPARSLAAPSSFVQSVKQSSLQGGVIAPAQAPPQATTSQS